MACQPITYIFLFKFTILKTHYLKKIDQKLAFTGKINDSRNSPFSMAKFFALGFCQIVALLVIVTSPSLTRTLTVNIFSTRTRI